MRISDWSSDVCSSDLIQSGVSGLKTGLQERLVEAELLCLFQCIGSQSHRLIFPDDLPVFVLIMIFELEQFLRDDHFAFHADDFGEVRDAAGAVPQTLDLRLDARRVGKEWVSTGSIGGW